MSSEICPFCGKSFKRLKSHLPHCKAAAANSKTTAHNEAREEKSARKLLPETKGDEHEAKGAARPKTSKKTTAKVSEKIKIAAKISPSVESPLTSKRKTNSHKSSQNHEQSLLESVKEMTNSVTKQNDTGSKTEKPDFERQILKTAIEKKSLNAKRATVSKKKDEKGFSTNKTGSTKATFTVNHETDDLKGNSWTEVKNGVKSLSGIEPWNKRETRITLEDVRTTLKRAKQSGKSKKDSLVDRIASEGKKIEILDQNEAENASAKVQKERPTRLTASESRQNEITAAESRQNEITAAESRQNEILAPESRQNEIAAAKSRQNEITAAESRQNEILAPESRQNEITAAESRQNEITAAESHRNEITAAESRQNEIAARKSDDFLSKLSKIENKDCSFITLRSETPGDGLRMDRHSGGRAAGWSPAHTLLEAEVSAEAFRKDSAPLLKPNVNAMEETTSDAKNRDGGRRAREALAQRRLGQVTLRELPDWLVLKSPRRPGDVMVAAQSGWQWYYRRYIDVKRGGVGGVAMLLAGYCVLSYVWTFPHLKRDRWRKYH